MKNTNSNHQKIPEYFTLAKIEMTLTTDLEGLTIQADRFQIRDHKHTRSYLSKHGVSHTNSHLRVKGQITLIRCNLFLVKWVHKWQTWAISSVTSGHNSLSKSKGSNGTHSLIFSVTFLEDKIISLGRLDQVALGLMSSSLLTLLKTLDHSINMIISSKRSLDTCKSRQKEGSLDLQTSVVLKNYQ